MRKFGVELEYLGGNAVVVEALRAAGLDCAFEGYNHQTRSHWKVVTDASVPGGYELVTPPLSNLTTLRAGVDALQSTNATVDRNCGLHVHIEAAGLTELQLCNVVKFYSANEAHIDAFMPPSRHESRWCKSLRRASNLDACTTMHELRRALHGDRYWKVNVECYWRQGTVEFRQHSGSVDSAKVANWVELLQALVDYAAANGPVRFASLTEMLTALFSTQVADASGAALPCPPRGEVARRVWEYMVAGVQREAIIAGMVAAGHKQSTVSALIYRINKRARLAAANRPAGTVSKPELIEFYTARAAVFARRNRVAA